MKIFFLAGYFRDMPVEPSKPPPVLQENEPVHRYYRFTVLANDETTALFAAVRQANATGIGQFNSKQATWKDPSISDFTVKGSRAL